ncbi:MAG: molybdopterin cofactor-binding domain-containing protein [Pseudomonadota bacterium]
MLDTVKVRVPAVRPVPPVPATPAAAVAAAVPAVPKLPGSLQTNRRLDQWLAFGPGRTVRIRTGKVEIGQGILTALVTIAAEELDLPVACIQVVPATTASGPDEAVTSGSLSMQHSGIAMRHACAEARRIALGKAAQAHGVAPEQLTVADGDLLLPGGVQAGDYWQWLTPADLDVEISGTARPKPTADYRLVGKGTPRIDLHDKVFGKARFVHDLRLPGMVHGRVVRPPSRSAQLVAAFPAGVETLPGVLKVVVDGRFVAVIAQTEEVAMRASVALAEACEWRESPDMPDMDDLAGFLLGAPVVTSIPHDTTPPETEKSAQAPGSGKGLVQHQHDYLKPFIAHASIAPSCSVAQWDGEKLEVWSNSQGIHNLRDDLVIVLVQQGLPVPEDNITVHHAEGAGAYGHNGADDVAGDAVLLAVAWPGAPVRVLWSRADELTWSPMGAAHLVRLSAATDADGKLQQWQHELWANGYMCRPGRNKVPTLLAAAHRACGEPPPIAVNMPFATGGGADRNAIPLYQVASSKAINHRLDVMPIRTSSIRGLGAFANVFAIESFVDEVAHATGADPVAYRRRHLLQDERALAVLDTVMEHCAWWNISAAERGEGVGHGFAIARYKHFGAWCAIAARVECTDRVRVTDLEIAVDVGQVIDPDGVKNQIEGGAIQSASWTLLEQVSFDRTRFTSTGWDSYPILRFNDVPKVRVHLIDRPDQDVLGAGEAVHGPVAGAIANAVFDALGVRVRTLPLSQENIMKAMDD